MAELRRSFYDTLLKWRRNKGKECLLVKGMRQIGKTFIIDRFGQSAYESYVSVNFVANPEIKQAFEGSLESRKIKTALTAFRPEIKWIPGKTLLFLDEIQECPEARTALKFLAADEGLDVIASGSLLGIKYKKGREIKPPTSIPVGYERQVTMHPLSFREYLWAKGYQDDFIDTIKGFFDRREMVPESINGKLNELVREYIVVGGMPEVVRDFVEDAHYGKVQENQEKLLVAIADDIHKYAEKSEIPKIEACLKAIPRILAKENRKFKYAEVSEGGSARRYLSSVEWLEASRVVSKAEFVSGLLVGLAAYVRDDWYKLYMADTGLLMAMYGMLAKRQVLDGSLKGSMKGGIYENLVANMLAANGLPLYYHRRDDGVEMEFVVEASEGVVPVEVKAQTGHTVSLDKLLRLGDIPYGYKLTGGNVGISGKKITLPHYMAMFLEKPAP